MTAPETTCAEPGARVRGGVVLCLALAASGAASLMYQVAWTRALCALTSATATAQAVVLSVFMAGLGIGSALAGQLSRRLRLPLAGYAVAEACAAGLAILGLPLVVKLSHLGASAGTEAELTDPLFLQLLLAGLYFLLPTILLGASLPLLLAHVQRATGSGARRGAWMGWLYGINTAGAVAGTLFAGFIGVESLGLRLTALLGAALALLAGLLALGVQFARRSEAAASLPPTAKAPTGSDPPLGRRVVLAAALGGLIGLGCEVVWTRLLSVVMVNTVHAFTLVLAAVLLGVALGGLLGGYLARRQPEPSRLRLTLSWMQLAAGLLAAAVPLLLLSLVASGSQMLTVARGEFSLEFLALMGLLVPPAALNAAVLPLLAAASGAPDGSRAFGRLYAINTAGGILGSLLAGFVMLPLLGSHATLTVLALCCPLVALLVLPAVPDLRHRLAILGTGVLLLLPLLTFEIPRRILELWLPLGERILELREGVGSDAMVTRTNEGQLRLWINSSWHSTTLGARHRLLGHLPALFCDNPQRMLGIAMGSGQTFAAALRHGPERFDAVEIDENILRLASKYFNEVTGGFFSDPRVRLHHADGRAFLRALRRPVDLIVLEPSQTWAAGMTTLYTREFYRDARARLAPDGVMAQMIPLYGQTVESLRAMVATALSEFPHAMLWQDQFEGILLLSTQPLRLDPETLRRRVRERGVGPDLRQNHLTRAADLLSLFLMGDEALRAWSTGAPLVEDDRPFLEFWAARVIGRDLAGEITAALEPRLEDPARYAASGAEAEVFAEARAVRDTLFALGMLRAGRDFEERARLLEQGLARAPGSERLRGFYRAEILLWANASSAVDPLKARAILLRGIETVSDFGEAGALLALSELRAGRADTAREILGRFAGFERTRALIEELGRQIDATPTPP
ncbi:MAG: fused MFS/spermidine synthase [Myxococcales bacterium]|nr:fused MFS/spermidine synthase [Myxococcales bacterium]